VAGILRSGVPSQARNMKLILVVHVADHQDRARGRAAAPIDAGDQAVVIGTWDTGL
jgi:hypothetical protein